MKESLKLDPRTKLMLLFTFAILVMGGMGSLLNFYMYLALCLLPFLLLYSTGQIKKTTIMLGIFLLLFLVQQGVIIFKEQNIPILLMLICQILVRFIPCIIMGSFAINSTKVSEFIAGMQKLHVPNEITIPMSVIFRLFPTIKEEFDAIRNAMLLRNITFGKTSISNLFEYRMVPLMICSVRIGEELSEASLTRGLGGRAKRTNICRIGFGILDYILWTYCITCFVLIIIAFLRVG